MLSINFSTSPFTRCSNCKTYIDNNLSSNHLCLNKNMALKQTLNKSATITCNSQFKNDNTLLIHAGARKRSLPDISFRHLLHKIRSSNTEEDDSKTSLPSSKHDPAPHSSVVCSSSTMTPGLSQIDYGCQQQLINLDTTDHPQSRDQEEQALKNDTIFTRNNETFNLALGDSTITMLYNNEVRNQCSLCSKDVLTTNLVMNKYGDCYHESCYTCTLCQKPFSRTNEFKLYRGKMYCIQDYQVMSLRSVRNLISAGDVSFSSTKVCCKCHSNLEGAIDFKIYRGRVYCKRDFENISLPKCRGCRKPIEEKAISAIDGKLQGKWHVECFRCQICHSSFPDNKFYVHNDFPYCKNHYHQLNNSLCRQCSNPVEGLCAYISKYKWRYHPDCFKCKTCNAHLHDTYFAYQNNVYCGIHIRQHQHIHHL